MEILELNLKHFGRFEDYTLKLHAGMNVISGDNETGKTTLHAFIRAMFYGLSRSRARALDEYQLRQPWENPSYFAGSMRILFEGKLYRIERNFLHREETLEVINETDGTKEAEPSDALARFLAFLSPTDFDNTVFIRQTGAQTEAQLAERLRNFLINVPQTGTTQTDVEKACALLKERRKQTEAKKKEALGGIEERIARNAQEIEFVNRDLEHLLERMDENRQSQSREPAFERVQEHADPEMPKVNDRSGFEEAEKESSRSVLSEDAEKVSGRSTLSEDAERVRRRSALSEEAEKSSGHSALEGAESETAGDLLLPVLILLSFAASALSGVCACFAAGLTLTIALGALAGLFAVMGALVLLRLLYPQTHVQRAQKRIRREDFLERHLGFREDPEDDLAQKRRRMRADQEQRMLLEAQERDRSEAVLKIRTETVRQAEAGAEAGDDAGGAMLREQARSEVLSREVRTRRERLEELKAEREVLYDQKAGLGGYDQELRAIELAQERIRELSGSLYRQSGEQFLQEASDLLSDLTDGRYTSLSLDDSLQLWINTPDRLLKVTQVSYAAMQQVYLALRLAAGALLSRGADLPLVLDEPFAMYDDARMEKALSRLSGLGRQVILFTCQKRELEVLAKLRA